MKKSNIQKRLRAYNPMKGFNYANRQTRNMFMVVFAVVGLVLLIGAFVDHSVLSFGSSGLSLASMAILGRGV